MSRKAFPLHSGPFTVGIALLMILSASGSQAAEEDAERTELAALVRQLDQIQRQADQASRLAPQERRRYHLDYGRLQTDLQRVRGGIQDYLTPPRAQPRDVQPLVADYRAEDVNGANGMGHTHASTARPALQQEERKP